MKILRCCLILLLIFWFIKTGWASTYIEVGDKIYEELEYLEAIGCIKSGLLTTLPLSQKEINRLIFEAQNTCGRDPEIKAIILDIKKKLSYDPYVSFFKPVEKLETAVGYASSEKISARVYNNDGERFKEDYNLRFRVTSLFSGKYFSAFFKPEVRVNKASTQTRIQKGYIVWSFHNVNILIGKESQWWGPGKNGSIILSNNAEPFTMVRIENESPMVLPWIGLVKGVFFATKLDKDQKVSHPYLWGMRFNIKPCPYLEIGISRTALLGGKGRNSNFNTWIKSILTINENQENPNSSEPGDQRAGFDLKLTIPWKVFPFQAYMEAEGEDEAGHLPYKWAYIYGLYLPKIPKLSKLSLRMEYTATNKVWYTHHIYGSKAYYYKGKVIGHHIGRDAESFWGEVEYRLFAFKASLKLGYEHIYYRLTDEKENRAYFYFTKILTSNLMLKAFFQYSWFKNFEGSNEDKSLEFSLLELSYQW